MLSGRHFFIERIIFLTFSSGLKIRRLLSLDNIVRSAMVKCDYLCFSGLIGPEINVYRAGYSNAELKPIPDSSTESCGARRSVLQDDLP